MAEAASPFALFNWPTPTAFGAAWMGSYEDAVAAWTEAASKIGRTAIDSATLQARTLAQVSLRQGVATAAGAVVEEAVAVEAAVIEPVAVEPKPAPVLARAVEPKPEPIAPVVAKAVAPRPAKPKPLAAKATKKAKA